MDIHFADAYQKHATRGFQLMAKPTGPFCNIDCTYCYYLEKEKLYRSSKKFRMSDKVLESFIRQYVNSQELPVVNFVWQGGEPSLAGLDFFKKAVYYQRKYAGNKKIANSFQTNGTLLNEEWCKFFARNNFLVGISIDGTENIHNKFRKYQSGKSSFSEVMKGIDLLTTYEIPFNTLTVVNHYSSHYPLEIYGFLKSTGSTFMQFLPAVEQEAETNSADFLELVSPEYQGNSNVTDWSVEQGHYGNFLVSIFDEWIKNDVGDYFVQIFDTTLANWVGDDPGLCVFQKTCGEAGVIEHNGDVYSCDHFVYPENYLGNIFDSKLESMMKSKLQNQFGLNKYYQLPQKCLSCNFLFACRGGCPKNRIIQTDEYGKRLNYLCRDYHKFFSHVTPYMNFMKNELTKERPPANVMKWARKNQAII